MIGVVVPLCEVSARWSAVSVVDAGVCLALRRRRRSDRGGRSRELDPRGADHCRNAVGTSTGAVFQRRHQVDYITRYWRQRAEERLGDRPPIVMEQPSQQIYILLHLRSNPNLKLYGNQ